MLPCRQTAPLFWHRVWVKAATKLEPWDSAWPVWTLLYSDILAKVLTWKSLLREGAFVNARIQMSECKFICWFCVNWLMSILEFRCLCARSCARGIQMSFCRFLYQSSDAGSVLMGECQCWNSHVFVQILVPEFTCQFCVNGWMPVVEFTCLCASSYARVPMPVLCEWVNTNVGIHLSLCKLLCQSSDDSSEWMPMLEFTCLCVSSCARVHSASQNCGVSKGYSPLVQFAFLNSKMLNYCRWQSCHLVSCFIQKGSVYYLLFIYSVSCLFIFVALHLLNGRSCWLPMPGWPVCERSNVCMPTLITVRAPN